MAILFVALAAAPSAVAQVDRDDGDVDTPALVIEATAGWDGTVDRTMPVPVSFLLSNFSNTVFEGRLVLRDPWNGTEADLGEIYLSEGATRSFSAIQALEDWSGCVAELRFGNLVLWRRELPLTTGLDFDTNKNFALIINDSTRQPSFPELTAEQMQVASTLTRIAPASGRPVKYLAVNSWQIPTHHAPLVAAQAMIFPEDTPIDDINKGQWSAIAKWVCMGGALFVRKDSRDVLQQLMNAAPLAADPADQRRNLEVRRMGLGAIYEYPGELFRDDGATTRQRIHDTIARLSQNHISGVVASVRADAFRERSGRADRNRMIVAAFFGLYTLFSGLVVLMLFRQSRRRVVFFTLSVVLGASVLAGFIGGMLRMSSGDVHQFTVTQAGAGGMVQMSKLEAQSAGGRNTKMAVQGSYPDLQFTGRVQRNFYYSSPADPGYPPFSFQKNLASEFTNIHQVHVPMTPWGRRQLYASAFNSEVRAMDIEIQFEPNQPGSEAASEAAGLIKTRIVNRLPFAVSDCSLIVGFARTATEEEAKSEPKISYQVNRYNGGQLLQQSTPTPIMLYHTETIAKLDAGAEWQNSSVAAFAAIQENRTRTSSWQTGGIALPIVPHAGSSGAWLIGRISESPILSIDEKRSDFVPQEELHIFVQEIPSEDMPDALVHFAKP